MNKSFDEKFINYKELECFLNILLQNNNYIIGVEFFNKLSNNTLLPYNKLILDNSNYDTKLEIKEHILVVKNIISTMLEEIKEEDLNNLIISINYSI